MGALLSTGMYPDSLEDLEVEIDEEEYDFVSDFVEVVIRDRPSHRTESDDRRRVSFRDTPEEITVSDPDAMRAYDRRGYNDPATYFRAHPDAYRKVRITMCEVV